MKWLLACVDVEATGRSPYVDRITQIAAVASHLGGDGLPLSAFNEYVYTSKPLSARVRLFNGITRDMLRDADIAPAVLHRMELWLLQVMEEHGCEGLVLAAHNGTRLDYPMIFHHYALLARSNPFSLITSRLPADKFLLLDTLPMLRALAHRVALLKNMQSFSLDWLHTQLTGKQHIAHDALHDCEALLAVFITVMSQVEVRGECVALVMTMADLVEKAQQSWRTRWSTDQATEEDEDRDKRLAIEEAEYVALQLHMQRKTSKASKSKSSTSTSKIPKTPPGSSASPKKAKTATPAKSSATKAKASSPRKSATAHMTARASSAPLPAAVEPPSDLVRALTALTILDENELNDDVDDEDDDAEWDVGSASDDVTL